MASQGQWWSILRTQRLQVLQWCVRSGLGVWHFLQKRDEPREETVMGWTEEGVVCGRVAEPLDSLSRSGSVVGRMEYLPLCCEDLDLELGASCGEPGSVKTATV